MTIVFSLIGPCGAGKTTMLDRVPGNLEKHKEGYVQKDSDTVHIDNRSYLPSCVTLAAGTLL